MPRPAEGRISTFLAREESAAEETRSVDLAALVQSLSDDLADMGHDVTFDNGSEGVIVAQGSRFGGYSMFVKDGTLYFVYNFLGIPPEQRVSASAPRSGRHVVGVDQAHPRWAALSGALRLPPGAGVAARA